MNVADALLQRFMVHRTTLLADSSAVHVPEHVVSILS